MTIGVVVVSYGAGAQLIDCLESLLAADGADLRVLVVDNASPDDTVERLRGWASGAEPWSGEGLPFAPRDHGPVELREFHAGPDALPAGVVGLLHTGRNGGFAFGVNRGLEAFRAMPDVDLFWILNPDAMAENATPAAIERAAAAAGRFGVIGGRTYYTEPPLLIQTDGGRIDLWTGRLLPANLGRRGRDVPGPERLEYVPGCHMVVGRDMLDRAGLMPEDYFLYFEEIDWCLRRGDLPLVYSDEIPVHHYSGASIGSASATQGPSPLSSFYMFRSRLRFVRRYRPLAVPITAAYALGKVAQMVRRGQRRSARSALSGLMGGLGLPMRDPAGRRPWTL